MPNPHPFVVHFPIALFLTAIICEVLAHFYRSKALSMAALVNSVLAAVTALLAVITGLLAKPLISAGSEVESVAQSHETLGYLTLATTIAFMTVKLMSHLKETNRYRATLIGIGLAGIVTTLLTAHEGGELVYRHGIGVKQSFTEESPLQKHSPDLGIDVDSVSQRDSLLDGME